MVWHCSVELQPSSTSEWKIQAVRINHIQLRLVSAEVKSYSSQFIPFTSETSQSAAGTRRRLRRVRRSTFRLAETRLPRLCDRPGVSRSVEEKTK